MCSGLLTLQSISVDFQPRIYYGFLWTMGKYLNAVVNKDYNTKRKLRYSTPNENSNKFSYEKWMELKMVSVSKTAFVLDILWFAFLTKFCSQ